MLKLSVKCDCLKFYAICIYKLFFDNFIISLYRDTVEAVNYNIWISRTEIGGRYMKVLRKSFRSKNVTLFIYPLAVADRAAVPEYKEPNIHLWSDCVDFRIK